MTDFPYLTLIIFVFVAGTAWHIGRILTGILWFYIHRWLLARSIKSWKFEDWLNAQFPPSKDGEDGENPPTPD